MPSKVEAIMYFQPTWTLADLKVKVSDRHLLEVHVLQPDGPCFLGDVACPGIVRPGPGEVEAELRVGARHEGKVLIDSLRPASGDGLIDGLAEGQLRDSLSGRRKQQQEQQTRWE